MRLLRRIKSQDRELADRLEQPVPRPCRDVATAKQALVEQRLQRLGIGVAHRLGSLERAASGEDAQSAKELLLVIVEQVVRPCDRGAERLLAGVRVTTGLEQVEPLTESAEQLLDREEPRSSGSELDCQRQMIQTPAELVESFGALERAPERPRAGEEELRRIIWRQSRHVVHVLALKL